MIDLRLWATLSVASLFASYLAGGVLLAKEDQGAAAVVLGIGYSTATILVVGGKLRVTKSNPGVTLVLSGRRTRFLVGLGLDFLGLALLALGPGKLAGASSDMSGTMFAVGMIFSVYGYYLSVSSYCLRPPANLPGRRTNA